MALRGRLFTPAKPFIPVAWNGSDAKLFDGEPDDRVERDPTRWNVELAERVGQERSSRVEDTRLDVEMGIRSLVLDVDVRCPMECQELRSIRQRKLVPILDCRDPVWSVPNVQSLNDAEFLATGEGKRLLASERHRIVLVQNRRIGRIEAERIAHRGEYSRLGDAPNGGLKISDVAT